MPCDGLELRLISGEVICSDITDFLLGEIETDDTGRFRHVVLSMPRAKQRKTGTVIVIWNTVTSRCSLTFTVTSCNYDAVMQASKIEGRWSAHSVSS